MNDGESFDCGHCVSDVFDANKGVWWNFDDSNITEISAFPEGVYTRGIFKITQKKETYVAPDQCAAATVIRWRRG